MHEPMDTNDEFLTSQRERQDFQKLLAKSGGESSEIIQKLKDDFDKQKEVDKEKEELRLNREIAYKRTLEKEMEEMRERLSFVTKECYSIKNEVTPELKQASKDVRKLQEELRNLLDNSYNVKKKIETLEPIF